MSGYPFDVEEQLNSLVAAYRQQNNLDYIKGIIGNVFGAVAVSGRPGWIYVRQVTSNGLSAARPVLAPSGKAMSLNAGDAVELEYTKGGQLRIAEPDTGAQLAAGVDPVAAIQQQQSPSTPQSNLETLRLIVKSGLIVSLKGWNPIVGTMPYNVSYADIDLTSYVPAAVGGVPQMCYAGIFVKADFTDVEIITSTPRAISDLPLGTADESEILAAATPGDTPAWAVKLVTGQTTIAQANIDNGSGAVDWRQMVNVASSGAAAQYPKRATMWSIDVLSSVSLSWSFNASQAFGNYVDHASPANGQNYTSSCLLQAGTYTVGFLVVKGADSCKFDCYIDGSIIGTTQDLYSGGFVFNTVLTLSSIVVATDGYHKFELIINGKNASSSGYQFRLTQIYVQPSAD